MPACRYHFSSIIIYKLHDTVCTGASYGSVICACSGMVCKVVATTNCPLSFLAGSFVWEDQSCIET